MDKGMIEKAPDGFTERVMMQIGIEKVHARHRRRFEREVYVFGISILTATALVVLAVLTTPQSNGYFDSIIHLFSSLNSTIPDFDTVKMADFNLPSLLFYISLAIALLSLFDLVLMRYFRQQE